MFFTLGGSVTQCQGLWQYHGYEWACGDWLVLPGEQFNNLVVDKNTGRVYIGAVNKLYQLSPNLELTVGGHFI